jgi:hypothetical protein
MVREKRTPLYNQLFLPARSVRVGQTWRGAVKIWGGAFATGSVALPAINTLEAVEWEHGVPTARIKSTYQGKAKLNNQYAGIQDGIMDIKGTSTFFFAPSSGKIVRAVHDIEGTLKLDTNSPTAAAGGSMGPGGPPGYGGGPGGGPGGPPGYGGGPGGGPGYLGPKDAPGGPGYGGPPGGGPGGVPGYGGGPGGPTGYSTPGGYDPTQNQGGPIPGVPIYQTYSLKIHAVATVA